MPERPIAIAVESVKKDFRLATEQRQTLKERVVNPRFDRSAKIFHALQDIDFDVKRGEFFGIVGRNGSGKSTLLKCMAGIYRIDEGKISIGGRLSTFIELGVGFNPDLAARDNIILNGIMLGLSPSEAGARVDEVIAFAELEDHTELKLKNYSSGMQVRLAFSVMTQIEADVLLIDEVLAVGDASFQAKCFEVFRQLREAGKTIVLVTHDMATVAKFCDRAMLIEDGVLVDIGDPQRIGDRYLSLNFERAGSVEALSLTEAPDENAPVEIPALMATRALLINEDDEVVQHVRTGDRAQLAVDVQANEDVATPIVTMEVRDDLDNIVFSATTMRAEPGTAEDFRMVPFSMRRLSVWFDAYLAPGNYRVRAVLNAGEGGRLIERSGDLGTFEITSIDAVAGIANLPHHVSWQAIEHIEQTEIPVLTPVGTGADRRTGSAAD